MSHYIATIDWTCEGDFAAGRYSRAHMVRFDGGIAFKGSASPSVVQPPWSAQDAVDPEEMLVAALSSCHMLSFLDIARRGGFTISRYVDQAEGTMARGADGRSWVSEVVLRPRIEFAGRSPSPADLDALHHRAHEVCFIANSVKTAVRVAAPDSPL